MTDTATDLLRQLAYRLASEALDHEIGAGHAIGNNCECDWLGTAATLNRLRAVFGLEDDADLPDGLMNLGCDAWAGTATYSESGLCDDCDGGDRFCEPESTTRTGAML